MFAKIGYYLFEEILDEYAPDVTPEGKPVIIKNENSGISKPLNNMWLYIFRIDGKGVAKFTGEYYVKDKLYYLANHINPKSANASKRDINSEGGPTIGFPIVEFQYESKHYFCTSITPIPPKRIQSFLSDLNNKKECRRLQYVNLHNRSNLEPIAIRNTLSQLQVVHAEFIKMVETFGKYVNDESEAGKAYIGKWIDIFCKGNPKYLQHLEHQGTSLNKWLTDWNNDIEETNAYAESYADIIVKLFNTLEFDEIAKDFTETEDETVIDFFEEIMADLTTGLSDTDIGNKYLAEILKNEKHFINTILLFKIGRKATKAFPELIGNLAKAIVLDVGDKKVQDIIDAVNLRWSNSNTSKGKKVLQIRSTREGIIASEIQYNQIKIPLQLTTALELINFYLTVQKITNSKTGTELTLNTLDTTACFFDILNLVLKNQVLKRGIGATKSIVYFWKSIDSVQNSNSGVTWGYALQGAGELIGVAGTITALSSFGPEVALFAFVTWFSGAIITSALEYTAIEKFMRYGNWGLYKGKSGKENWSDGDFSTWKNDIHKQVKVLNKLLFDFECSAMYSDSIGVATLKFYPRMALQINELSTFKLNNGFSFRPIVDYDKPYLTIKRTGNNISEIELRLLYDGRKKHLTSNAHLISDTIPPLSIEVAVERDVYSDGKMIIKNDNKIAIRENNVFTKLKDLFG
jgi:hypothetical protein